MRPFPGPTLILFAPCENRAKEPSEPVEPQLNGRIQDHQHAARQGHARPETGHVGRTAHEGAVGQPRDNRHGWAWTYPPISQTAELALEMPCDEILQSLVRENTLGNPLA